MNNIEVKDKYKMPRCKIKRSTNWLYRILGTFHRRPTNFKIKIVLKNEYMKYEILNLFKTGICVVKLCASTWHSNFKALLLAEREAGSEVLS